MKPITDRIRVFLFDITVALLGLINPAKALQTAYQVLGEVELLVKINSEQRWQQSLPSIR